ncbi:hypothetical protein GA0115245_11657 [Streptomyces sp. di188]|nr:hypothetical protein GA0115238_11077 [Streptomyces sp. di50b]SCD91801.1 hypothetical protein GA0115245_11657 [Streptomyces sp. di188]
MWAKNSGKTTCPAISRRLRSLQAGPMSLTTAGLSLSGMYQPVPKPSPLVVSTPLRACRLWSIRECTGRWSRFSSRIGVPEQASRRHMSTAFPVGTGVAYAPAGVRRRAHARPGHRTHHRVPVAPRGRVTRQVWERPPTHSAQMTNPEKAIITTDQTG